MDLKLTYETWKEEALVLYLHHLCFLPAFLPFSQFVCWDVSNIPVDECNLAIRIDSDGTGFTDLNFLQRGTMGECTQVYRLFGRSAVGC